MTGCQVISVCLASCCPSGLSGDPYWFLLLVWNLARGQKVEKFTVRVGCAMHLLENLRRRSFSHADAVGTDKFQMMKETLFWGVAVLVFVFSLRWGWSLRPRLDAAILLPQLPQCCKCNHMPPLAVRFHPFRSAGGGT